MAGVVGYSFIKPAIPWLILKIRVSVVQFRPWPPFLSHRGKYQKMGIFPVAQIEIRVQIIAHGTRSTHGSRRRASVCLRMERQLTSLRERKDHIKTGYLGAVSARIPSKS